jgi:hypothetical protein
VLGLAGAGMNVVVADIEADAAERSPPSAPGSRSPP